MCLRKEKIDIFNTKQPPTSPWRRIIKQQLKPKLSRSVVNGAKINLNRYWAKFEQLSNNKSSLMTFIRATDDHPPPVMVTHQFMEDNEINDNIFNETMELEF